MPLNARAVCADLTTTRDWWVLEGAREVSKSSMGLKLPALKGGADLSKKNAVEAF